jgi:hypothetical protein
VHDAHDTKSDLLDLTFRTVHEFQICFDGLFRIAVLHCFVLCFNPIDAQTDVYDCMSVFMSV